MRTTVAVLAVSALLGVLTPTAHATDATVLPIPVSPPQTSSDQPPAPAPAPADALSRALTDGDISRARYALERARTLFRPAGVERRYGHVEAPDAHEATLLLRDLALRGDDLAPAPRREARRILARPTDGPWRGDGSLGWPSTLDTGRRCSDRVCVHWVRGASRHAPSRIGVAGDGVPAQVEATLAAFNRVWRVEVGMYGYRRPVSDAGTRNNGGDARMDVYLSDTGAERLYGYCAPDGPATRQRTVAAYCVVDEDFSRTQFAGSPEDSLRATAAHEFFHAVQFAYDWREDGWLMEGTAAWVEDEVYDAVNDNYQYLYGGPLSRPQRELDRAYYEPWVFFRFMAEYFGSAKEDRPIVVRQIWERASRPGQYSLEAVQRVAAAHGTPFRRLFADFGWTQPFAAAVYEEGRSYPVAPMTRSINLSSSSPATGSQVVTLHHLSNRHIALRPGSSLAASSRLTVDLNLPDRVRGSEATLSVVRGDGVVRPYAVRLDRRGNGTRTVDFPSAGVRAVVLTLTNASTRMRCNRATMLSCAGQPRDDGLRFRYSARVR